MNNYNCNVYKIIYTKNKLQNKIKKVNIFGTFKRKILVHFGGIEIT